MATAEDIVTRALSRLSILRIGGVPDAAQSAQGLTVLNAMIAAWYADGVQIDLSQPFPAQHEEGITAMLALKIAPSYGEAAVVPQTLAKDARDGWERLLAQYVFAPNASFDSAIRNLASQRLTGQRGTLFNILSVTPSSTPSAIGFCTLAAGYPTTVVADSNCLVSSTITLTPYTEAAQVEWNTIRPIVAAGPAAGQFTITHQNNAVTDRTFEYLIII
jgi:hypothetical protein